MKPLQEQYEVFDIELTEEEAKKLFKKEYVKEVLTENYLSDNIE
jgi:hypothetical protein